jgi:NAD(P)-dependent dehydrogenase (short-subunit alcohol dehydrogenase family)
VLVNNAAYSPVAPIGDLPASKWRAALMVNVWAPAALAQAFLAGMLHRGAGRILNVGSSSAVETIPGTAPYCVTKCALERLTQAVAAEVDGTGVSATCIRIDERIATDADALMAARGIGVEPAGSSSTSDADFGRAVAWLAVSDAELNGCVLTLAELRDLTLRGTSAQDSDVML